MSVQRISSTEKIPVLKEEETSFLKIPRHNHFSLHYKRNPFFTQSFFKQSSLNGAVLSSCLIIAFDFLGKEKAVKKCINRSMFRFGAHTDMRMYKSIVARKNKIKNMAVMELSFILFTWLPVDLIVIRTFQRKCKYFGRFYIIFLIFTFLLTMPKINDLVAWEIWNNLL